VINASNMDVVAAVKDLLDGQGVHYSFEAIGHKVTAEQCFGMLRPGGLATIIGMIPFGTKIELHGADFLRDRKIQGTSMGGNRFRVDMPRMLTLWKQGRLKLDHLITGHIKLEQVNEGYAQLKSGAPLRNPTTGELIGDSPFMNGLIGMITMIFLVSGWAYGVGAGTLRTLTDAIKAIEKAITGMGGTIFLFFVLSQFVAYFTYTNMGAVLALQLAGVLTQANIGALPLLIGFIVVVAIIDILLTGAIAKWAIFAPVFVPLLMKLGVEPEAVLAAYRVADSPMNAVSPLNAYFALVVGYTMKYDRNSGVGTVVSLMLPYVALLFVIWTALFIAWQSVGLPWGV
jgi:hypothetical protein